MLRNAACFAGRHLALANVIQQRGLAVIDVAHDSDDRRPWLLGALMLRQGFLELLFQHIRS